MGRRRRCGSPRTPAAARARSSIGKLTGHNGTVANLTAKPKIIGCPPTVTLKRRGGKLRATAKPGRDGAKIRSRQGRQRTKNGYRVTVKDRGEGDLEARR